MVDRISSCGVEHNLETKGRTKAEKLGKGNTGTNREKAKEKSRQERKKGEHQPYPRRENHKSCQGYREWLVRVSKTTEAILHRKEAEPLSAATKA